MKIKSLFLSAVLATATASTVLSASPAPDLSKLPAPAKKVGVTYASDIKPIFEASCFRCHGAERPKSGLRLDSLEGVLKGSKDGKVIIPGKSADSPLVLAVARVDEKKAMPPSPRGPRPGGPGGPGQPGGPGGPPRPNGPGDGKGPGGPPGGPGGRMGPMPKPLTIDQVSLIRAWVDQGAK
jgi:hypothetical protein